MKLSKYILIIFILILVIPALSISAVVFEDDFSNDIGWSKTNGGTWSCQQGCQPSKWTAYYGQPNSDVSIVAGAGEYGSAALKVGYPITAAPGQLGLAKHLTGNKSTGYDELYIRLKLRFDNDWQVGTGTSAQAWKIFRLWQYRSPTNTIEWTENKDPMDTRWLITTMNGSLGQSWGTTCNVNTNNDSHHEQIRLDWYGNNGYNPTSTNGNFGSINEWDYNHSNGYFNCYPNCNQGWHYVEFHIKLSTIDAPGNGIFEMWLDGTKQITPTHINQLDPPRIWTALSTKKYQGGINWIQLFDNMQRWTENWTKIHYVYLNNIVVSTSYIGPSYVIGNPIPDTMPPAAPQQLR